MEFKDIKEGMTLYEKWHKVSVIDIFTDVPKPNDVAVLYVNSGTGYDIRIRGASQLSETPINCWNCKRDIIDNVKIKRCFKCRRAICPSCSKCHCGTTWDPIKRS